MLTNYEKCLEFSGTAEKINALNTYLNEIKSSISNKPMYYKLNEKVYIINDNLVASGYIAEVMINGWYYVKIDSIYYTSNNQTYKSGTLCEMSFRSLYKADI